jgi:hypothetical protein
MLDGATFLNALGQSPVPSKFPTNQDATQYAEASGTVRDTWNLTHNGNVTADALAAPFRLAT